MVVPTRQSTDCRVDHAGWIACEHVKASQGFRVNSGCPPAGFQTGSKKTGFHRVNRWQLPRRALRQALGRQGKSHRVIQAVIVLDTGRMYRGWLVIWVLREIGVVDTLGSICATRVLLRCPSTWFVTASLTGSGYLRTRISTKLQTHVVFSRNRERTVALNKLCVQRAWKI